MALSDSWLKAAYGKEGGKATEKSDRDGLSVRVSAKGKITFQFRFRYAGKPQRCDIGTYPLITLKDARAECLKYRAALEQGEDPRIVKALLLAEKEQATTVADLFIQWFDSDVKGKKVSASESWRSIELHILPEIGKLPADQLTLHHWLPIIERMTKKTPAMAVRVLTQCKLMLRWAVRRKLVMHNPLADITAKRDLHVAKKQGERTLTDQEIAWLFEYFDSDARMEPKNMLFMKLCLFYGCRNGELRRAKKSDFDFINSVWTIPPENRKTGKKSGRPMKRPIPDEFKADIEMLMCLSAGEYLVPLRDKDSPMTTSASLSLPYRVMAWLKKNKGISMDHWSLHDLRRTARTNFGPITMPNIHVAEIMLDHTIPGMWHVYDKEYYLPEQMLAYKAWHRKLMQITGQVEVNNIVEMKRISSE
ncbi:integrase family protein [Rheinheimera sp. MMS21-TC3]|uniref:tyrosine-type recombinase/integrase n=1 Tax=Rheinheimera sp. MMS21-TC3 TaxID=3072790 RepID=UPI0028C50E4B|nr:integrase family protein [Rheinheimera sp. MMS21-TC3]WNO60402.1 integrase family protein [Rheinheimera sp. MMS21-TC3]